MENENVSKNRESKILEFIKKNPLCVRRKISRSAEKIQIRDAIVKKELMKLLTQRQIGSITHGKPKSRSLQISHYVIPKVGQEDRILWKIMNEDKIFTHTFRNLEFRNIRGKWTFPLLVRNFIAWFHLQSKLYFFGKNLNRRKIKNFQREFLEGWKTYVNESKTQNDNAIHSIGFVDFIGTIIAEDYPNHIKYLNELKVHKFTLKKRMQLMNKFLEEGDFKGVALTYDKRKYKRKERIKFKITPKYIKSLLKPIMTNDGKFSWKKALAIQEIELGLFGGIFDPEFVKLLRESDVNDTEILKYAFESTGRFDRTEKQMKRFIRQETGISVS